MLCTSYYPARYSCGITFGDEDYIVTYAMAVSFGKLEEFDTANGKDWVQYIEQMEHFFWPMTLKILQSNDQF